MGRVDDLWLSGRRQQRHPGGPANAARQNPLHPQVRHEEGAAFMACAYAKFTGELGVCLSTSGPGAVHLLNGRTPSASV
ncbi:MAG TPA: thiamine pyrophosphate-binding protein [Pirellulales bacterium]|nr:thiamine pyrophosphate-binding protein [Pirellulales bacterium]